MKWEKFLKFAAAFYKFYFMHHCFRLVLCAKLEYAYKYCVQWLRILKHEEITLFAAQKNFLRVLKLLFIHDTYAFILFFFVNNVTINGTYALPWFQHVGWCVSKQIIGFWNCYKSLIYLCSFLQEMIWENKLQLVQEYFKTYHVGKFPGAQLMSVNVPWSCLPSLFSSTGYDFTCVC